MIEHICIVSEDDVQVGIEDKFVAHRYPVKRHRAVSVWLLNAQNEVLLQQRSQEKIVGAGWWANTVCGNVWADESYEECALRRLKNELGIVLQPGKLQEGSKFEYRAYCNETYGEHEIDQIFTVQVENISLDPNPQEVANTLWVNFDLLKKRVLFEVSEQGYYSAEQSLVASWNELAENMSPLSMIVEGEEISLAPWTVMMITGELV